MSLEVKNTGWLSPPSERQLWSVRELRRIGTAQNRWSYLKAPGFAVMAAIVAVVDIPILPAAGAFKGAVQIFAKGEHWEGAKTIGEGLKSGGRSIVQVVYIVATALLGLIPYVRIWVYAQLPEVATKKFICIAVQDSACYVGHSDKRQLMPDELKEIILENGELLTLDPKDFFIDCWINDGNAKGANGRNISTQIALPSVLFKDKKEGERVRFRYKGELLELILNQNGHPIVNEKFEETLAESQAYVEKYCDIELPKFCKYDPYWWYTLGENDALYKLTEKFTLEKRGREDFRPKKNPSLIDLKRRVTGNQLTLQCECAGMGPENIDIIVNNHHLIIYGYVESPLGFDPREIIAHFRWDRCDFFKNFTLEKMKETVEKSKKLSCTYGIFRIVLDLN